MGAEERATWSQQAQPGTPWSVATGLAQVPVLPASPQGLVFGGAAWDGDEAQPLIVAIGQGAAGGQLFEMNDPAQGVTTAILCVRIEYGTGNVQRTILCDLRSGAIQLPPSKFARVGIFVQNGAVGVPINVPMAINVGSVSQLDNPTFTTGILGGSIPVAARWFEFITPGTLTLSGGAYLYTQQAFNNGGPQNPAHAPVRIVGSTFSFTPDVAWTAANQLKFVLSL